MHNFLISCQRAKAFRDKAGKNSSSIKIKLSAELKLGRCLVSRVARLCPGTVGAAGRLPIVYLDGSHGQGGSREATGDCSSYPMAPTIPSGRRPGPTAAWRTGCQLTQLLRLAHLLFDVLKHYDHQQIFTHMKTLMTEATISVGFETGKSFFGKHLRPSWDGNHKDLHSAVGSA